MPLTISLIKKNIFTKLFEEVAGPIYFKRHSSSKRPYYGGNKSAEILGDFRNYEIINSTVYIFCDSCEKTVCFEIRV